MINDPRRLIQAWLKFLSEFQCVPEATQDYLRDSVNTVDFELKDMTNFYWHCGKCGHEWPREELDEPKPKCPKCERVVLCPEDKN